VRSRYKRQLIQLNMNKSGLHGLEWKTRDPYSLVDDSLVTRTHCIDPASVLVSLWNDCSFLGMCNFYRRFVSDYAQVARPLAAMTTFKTPDRLGTFTFRRGLGGVRGAQEAAHGGTHRRFTAAPGGLHAGHGRKRGTSRRGPTAGTTRPIHAARWLLELLPQRGRAEL